MLSQRSQNYECTIYYHIYDCSRGDNWGITNVIAIRMLFHPFKPYYIFKFRVPFTPGLIPKRREEIATKIGQVIEEHLLTETLINEKLKSEQSQQAIESMIQQQLQS